VRLIYQTIIQTELLTSSEYMITFALADPAYVRQQADLRGFMVRFFHRDIESLPQPKVGDIVVLRDVKVCTLLVSR